LLWFYQIQEEKVMQKESMRTISQVQRLIKEDAPYDSAVYLRPKQGMERYNMSRPQFCKLALEAGSLLKIGSMVLIEKDSFERYLESFRIPAGGNYGI